MRNWFLIFIALVLAFLVVYRSWSLPITHDEASTWFNYRHLNVWSCLSNAACWGTANNHWLNTLLLQWSANVFGDMPWALRLPNVLAGLGYMVCALFISTRYTDSKSLQCAGFLLLCGHTYLLDFFSLARGYGLMASGVIWGIYCMLRYVEKYELRWLVLSSSALTLGILGNFTGLLPWVAIGMGWSIRVVMMRKYNLLFRHGLVWLLNAILLFVLLNYPIRLLSKSGEFGWGSKNVWQMASDLVINLLYGERIFGENSSLFILIGFSALSLAIFYFALQKKNLSSRDSVILLALFVVLNLFVIMLNQYVTGSLAPIGRKTIYLIPFIFGFFVLGLQFIHNRKAGFFTGLIISVILLYRIPVTAHTTYCREWYTDSDYHALFESILPRGSASDSIHLSSSWIFNPSLRFYRQTIPLPIAGLPYQRPLVIDASMDYYYVESSDTLDMKANGFVLDKRIGFFFLFRNKQYIK
ncbi:MAG: hypothetical protein IPP15_10795 [Saprospiraceae bacterium]|uniref:Glycosyltransferase RgtA/B/C/D-like domain-containing protein n=1 Tax=Candidatus Opimibacter skivensis TaxID=2982028 RepID=A0A9D7XST8_9BACT|nr:hypothetical protein [Candidatus Opimibacter skivensis]